MKIIETTSNQYEKKITKNKKILQTNEKSIYAKQRKSYNLIFEFNQNRIC